MLSKKELEIQILCEEFYKVLGGFDNVISFEKKVDAENIKSAVDMLERNYPEIFWLNGYSYSYYNHTTEVVFNTIHNYKPETLKKMNTELYHKTKEIVRITNKPTDYEKILAVHDYLVSHTVYTLPKSEKGRALPHTAYGCMVEGKAVCAGYSKAFKLLMKAFKIECGICSGIARKESHAWNYVKLGGNYYWIDVTWDDPVCREKKSEFEKWIQHDYFLLNDDMIFRTRKLNKTGDFVPSCYSVKDNYFVRNKLFFKDYKFAEIDKLLSARVKEGRIEMMFESKRDLQNAVRDLFENNHFWNAKIFEAKNGRKGGSVSYQSNDDLYTLRIIFKINP
ncbi:MAG: hypothetical protein IJ644_07995 [Oscillospiraceae bacterium]|nr:hypothetical protein [Oscillospiraceae bacterium]